MRVRFRSPPQRGYHVGRDLAQVQRLQRQRAAADARHLQQRPDQVVHASGGLAHARQVVAPGVVDLVRIALAEQAAESLDRPQRRAQVVGDAVSERLELLVGVRSEEQTYELQSLMRI